MALLTFAVAAVFIALYAAYSYLSSFLARRRLQRFADANGAVVPRLYESKWPWGLDRLWRVGNSSKTGEDILDDIVAERFNLCGHTFASPGLMGRYGLNTIDPVNIQAVLATKFQDFELGEQRNTQFGAFLGKGIFTSDGPFWEHSRALFRPQFARAQINNLEKTEEAVQALFSVLPSSRDAKQPPVVDLMPLFFRFTLDTATDFLFGESVESQLAAAGGDVGSAKNAATAMAADQAGADMSFADAFQEAQEWISWRIRLQGLYFLVPSAKGRRAAAYVRKYIAYYVRLALRTRRRKLKGQISAKDAEKWRGKKYNLLEALTEDTQDPQELSDQILGILLAGRDTTSTLLSWTVLLLSQHRRVFTKLRHIILLDFGTYGSSPDGITFESLKACHYLQYVLREVLRLYTVVPFNNRMAVRDTILPTGGGPDGKQPIAVPKGTSVNYVPYLVHRRKDIWGSDADEFLPERWDGKKLDWSFIPFSGGPRVCLGQQFALTEAAYCLVRMLQRFENIEWAGPQGKPAKRLTLTMCPKHGVPVYLTESAF